MRHAQKVIKQRHNSVTYYGINIQKSFIQFANVSMNLAKPAEEVTTILCQSAKSPAKKVAVFYRLPLYKISVLLKTGGAGSFIITRMINVVIKAPIERFDR